MIHKWKSELRYRQIHLDFHTSEHIPDIGKEFKADEFVSTLKHARVNSITLFARGHHGWCYYPSKVGTPHPRLTRPDLLGEMLTACRKADINVPIYLTVQWDELTAREHPEWRVIPPFNPSHQEKSDQSGMAQFTPTWHAISLIHTEYIDFLIAQALEVIQRYNPDGLFMDIVQGFQSVDQKSLDSMRTQGLDPRSERDRKIHDRYVVTRYMRRFTEAVWKIYPDMRIFHNSGHLPKGKRELLQYFSHVELESLPTGGWGYDHFPVSARYAATLDMEYLGMTGKFHSTWGKFGGYKRPEALEYECCLMMAHGARCSIGDQLHPSGRIDPATYATITPAYKRVEALEPFVRNARSVADVAILSAEASVTGTGVIGGTEKDLRTTSDAGAARMLSEEHIPFDVIDSETPFEHYPLLVLPDIVRCDGELGAKVQAYLDGGGKCILSGSSGMDADAAAFALHVPFEFEGGCSPFNPTYLLPWDPLEDGLPEEPFVVYAAPYLVKAGSAGILAEIRNPYFNRTWDHFCSHQHAPYNPEPVTDACGAVYTEQVGYFSHPLFSAYVNDGQPLYRYLFRSMLKKLLPQSLVITNLPSAGRVTVTCQADQRRTVVHLLYAQTQLRAPRFTLWNGEGWPLEIIEDALPLTDVACRVRVAEDVSSVYLADSGVSLPFEREGAYISFIVPRVYIHQVVVLEQDMA